MKKFINFIKDLVTKCNHLLTTWFASRDYTDILELYEVKDVIDKYLKKGYTNISYEGMRYYSFPNKTTLTVLNPLVYKKLGPNEEVGEEVHCIVSYSEDMETFEEYFICPVLSTVVNTVIRPEYLPIGKD